METPGGPPAGVIPSVPSPPPPPPPPGPPVPVAIAPPSSASRGITVSPRFVGLSASCVRLVCVALQALPVMLFTPHPLRHISIFLSLGPMGVNRHELKLNDDVLTSNSMMIFLKVVDLGGATNSSAKHEVSDFLK